MAIISGVNIPDNKRVEISLRSIYGIGPHQAHDVIERAGIEGNPRVRGPGGERAKPTQRDHRSQQSRRGRPQA